MLEVIIKQNDRQIGQLQFDSNWKYDDAMKVLSIYVSREIPRNTEGEVMVLSTMKAPQRDVEEGPPPDVERGEPETIAKDNHAQNSLLVTPSLSIGGFVGFDDRDEGPELNPDDFYIIDRFAIGKKRVMKYKHENVTGNQVATLVALRDLGGRIEVANELAPKLNKDARYESQHLSSTYRTLLAALADFGWVERADNDSKVINGLGRKIASMFPSLPKAADTTFSDQVEPT